MDKSVLGSLGISIGLGGIKSEAVGSSSSSSSLFNRSTAFDYGGGHRRNSSSAAAGSMMDSGHRFGSGGGIEFSVEAATSRENRVAVGEMDFFSGEKKKSPVAVSSSSRVQPDLGIKKEDLTINTGLHLSNTRSDQSTIDDGISPNEDDKEGKEEQLAAMQAELGRMNEENQKLKMMLSQVTANYNTLQVHLVQLVQQRSQQTQHSHEASIGGDGKISSNNEQGAVVPRQFLDLGPAGETNNEPSHSSSASLDRSASPPNNEAGSPDYRLSKRGVSNDDANPEHGWNPNKAPKLDPSKSNEQAQEATMRKARVSVRARSEAPMITDGCQWRKYGQKMAKGNPCPRAYYRCTMATGCPVRKQVQRCAEDRSILITTYEGTHNHPLPPAAMAMASTTSAAASMLLSGSMSSADGMMSSNFLTRTILPCSSNMATISASAPFPTVTLDLTHNPNNPLQLQRPQAQFQVPFGAPAFGGSPPQPQLFGQSLYNQSKFSGLQMSPDVNANPKGQAAAVLPPALADTVSAATAAITADPNFTAVLAAAISSIIGGNHPAAAAAATGNNSNNNNGTSSSNHTAGSNFPST